MILASKDITILEKIENKDELSLALSQAGRSELISLFNENNINDLSNNLEILLEEHKEDDILRLLWASSQIKNKILPSSIIASSVSEVLKNESILKTAPRLCFLVCSLLSRSLIEEKEYRIGLLILSNITTLDFDIFFNTDDEKELFLKLLDFFIKEEKTLAVDRKEEKSYFDYLNNTEKNLKEIILNKKSSKFKNSNNSSSNFEKTLNIDNKNPNIILSEPSIGFISSKNENIKEHVRERNDNSNLHNLNYLSKNIKFTLSITLLIFISIIYFRDTIHRYIFQDNIGIEEKLIISFSDSSNFKPSATSLPPFSNLSSNATQLEEINERLKGILTQNNKPSIKNENNNIKHKPYLEIEDLESINDIPESEGEIPEAKIPEAKPIPKFNSSIEPKKLPIPENLGTSENPVKVDSKNDNKSNSQNYPHATPQQNIQNQYPPIKNDEAEYFNPPLVFETTSATNVLSAPTYFSPSITRLHAKSLVEVTARLGIWLEIKSNAGQIGYILEQDTIKSDRPNRRLEN